MISKPTKKEAVASPVFATGPRCFACRQGRVNDTGRFACQALIGPYWHGPMAPVGQAASDAQVERLSAAQGPSTGKNLPCIEVSGLLWRFFMAEGESRRLVEESRQDRMHLCGNPGPSSSSLNVVELVSAFFAAFVTLLCGWLGSLFTAHAAGGPPNRFGDGAVGAEGSSNSETSQELQKEMKRLREELQEAADCSRHCTDFAQRFLDEVQKNEPLELLLRLKRLEDQWTLQRAVFPSRCSEFGRRSSRSQRRPGASLDKKSRVKP